MTPMDATTERLLIQTQLAHTNNHLQAMRRRYYLATAFMCGTHAATLTAAIEANDLDTAQVIWEKHTGLTGP
jgi:hypothetical protein